MRLRGLHFVLLDSEFSEYISIIVEISGVFK